MNASKSFQVALLLTAGLLSGCGDEAKEVTQHIRYPELMATWAGKCADEPIFDAASANRYYMFGGNDVKEVLELYSDGDCQAPVARLTYEGELTVEGKAANLEDAHRIRVTKKKAFLQTLSDEGATLLEAVNACGNNDWAKGTRREVTEHAGDLNCPIGELPESSETAVKVQDDTLVFATKWFKGDEIDEPATRLDEDNRYTKTDKTF